MLNPQRYLTLLKFESLTCCNQILPFFLTFCLLGYHLLCFRYISDLIKIHTLIRFIRVVVERAIRAKGTIIFNDAPNSHIKLSAAVSWKGNGNGCTCIFKTGFAAWSTLHKLNLWTIHLTNQLQLICICRHASVLNNVL